jgi:hypothetical protein
MFISDACFTSFKQLQPLFSFLQRRKLLELQEEHSDLLGLLAQQEIELTVFRSSLHSHCGAQAVTAAEAESERTAIQKYGTYTNFRGGGSQ